jgi:putative membrane protein
VAGGGFFQKESKQRVTSAIKEVEATTSAQLVVAVHHVSGCYRDVDYLVGFAVSLALLVAMLFAPPEFPDWSFAAFALLAFAGGAAVSSMSAPLHRLLVRERRMREAVHAEACATFVKLGVSRTRGRSGILVFVSTYERRAEVVLDVGVDRDALGAPFAAALAAIEASAARLDLEAFVAGLLALGPPLAAGMPHLEGGVNELPDEVDAA